jgi:aldehyde:ferredoxin oxidoreductase
MQPILRVDLNLSQTSQILVPLPWEADFLGGASLAARMLYERLTPDLDPLAPQAPLLFLNGPLSGTVGPAVGRTVACARSPLTRLWGESNIGGFWGTELRRAGYDGLWIEGRASEPVYLWIEDGSVDIRPARHLWGLDTYATIAQVETELQTVGVRVATIGPAGEAQIPFAVILSDHGRVAGRTGMGAVMGSKNLKAIAVHGHGVIPVANPAAYQGVRAQANQELKDDPMTVGLREMGTAANADYFDYLGEMPKRYFQDGKFPEELRITGATIRETILAGVKACHGCVIACGRVVRLEDGEKRKGPEYETLVGFGPNLGINDAALVTRFGELCDRYGMDTISLSNTLGLAFHLYELGRIGPAEAEGLELSWGNAAAVEKLIHQTAHRQGLGAVLALGARGLGRHFNAEAEAVQVNGLEVAYHDPRGFSGMALVYATSPRGACHNQSDYFFADMGQVDENLGMKYYSARAGAEKAANVAIHQNWRTTSNSLIICILSNTDPNLIANLTSAACGQEWTIADLLRCGERGWNLKRVINKRLGLRRRDDQLPKALLQPYRDGTNDGFVPDFGAMLAEYYRVRGWDPVTGYPTRAKLSELGLDWAAEDIYTEAA